MKKGKLLVAVLLALVVSFTVAFLVACEDVETHTVRFYDTQTGEGRFLFEIEVEDGETLPAPLANGAIGDNVPTVQGRTFRGWFSIPGTGGNPNTTIPFNFANPITQDTNVFGAFGLPHQADTRLWHIAGTGTSNRLLTSAWGASRTEAHRLDNESTATENIFEIYTDLNVGDQFQIIGDANPWDRQRGFGYLIQSGTHLTNAGNHLATHQQLNNIGVATAGHFRIRLITHPQDDFMTVADFPQQINPFDRLYIERISDAIEEPLATLRSYYIRGPIISNNIHMGTPRHRMSVADAGHRLTRWMSAGEIFHFHARDLLLSDNSVADVWGDRIDRRHLTATSQAFFRTAGNDLITTVSGLFTFEIIPNLEDNAETTLAVTVNQAATRPQFDFYLNGAFGEFNWNFMHIDNILQDRARLNRVGTSDSFYIIREFAVGDQFTINSFNYGYEGGAGMWNERRMQYQYPFVVTTPIVAPVDADNLNIAIQVAGEYIIVMDSATGRITVMLNDRLDMVYVAGNLNGWTQVEEFRLSPDSENRFLLTIELTLTATVVVGENTQATAFMLRRFAHYNPRNPQGALIGTGIGRGWPNLTNQSAMVNYVTNELGTGGFNITIAPTGGGTFRIVYNLLTSQVTMTRVV